MKTNDEIEPIEVFSGSLWEAELLKSLLENAGIESFLNDEYTGTIAPWYTAPGGAGSVKVVVSNQDFEQSKSIVEEFVQNQKD